MAVEARRHKSPMAILPKSSAFSFSILTILLISFIFASTVYSIDDNLILLPSDRENNDHSICPNVNDQVSCPVKCFTTHPVCGEDGVTYWCDCADAHCAGTRVAKLDFCQVGNGGAGPVSGQALLLVHIVWLILLGLAHITWIFRIVWPTLIAFHVSSTDLG